MLVLAWRISTKVRTLGFDFWPLHFWRAESSVEMAAKCLYSCTAALLGTRHQSWLRKWFWILQINQYDVSAKEFDTHYLQMVDSSIAQQDCHSVSHCGFRRFRLSIPTAPILMPRTANINQFWLVVSETKNVGITKDMAVCQNPGTPGEHQNSW